MLISIIIPVYNVADYIERSLLSALNQEYSNIEILIIDDCATDYSMNIVNSVLSHHPRSGIARIITHTTNKGLSEARNSGLKQAKGEYVFFLDSDDTITPDCILSLTTPISQYYPECVVADYEVSDPAKYKKPPFLLKEGYYNGSEILNNIYLKRKMMNSMACNKLYQKDFLIRNNLFFKKDIFHEDELWSFQLFTLLDSLFMIQRICYRYEIRPNSISQKSSRKRYSDKMIITREMDYWIKTHPKLLTNPKLLQFFEDWKNKLFRTILRADFNDEEKNNYYIDLRNVCPTTPTKIILNRCSLKQFIRKIHYFLKPELGFRLMAYLMK